MKVKKVIELKKRFSFEAPIFKANLEAKKNGARVETGQSLDLNSYLAPRPAGVYLVRVTGDSMIDERIYQGDVLVVDGKETPKEGCIVIASLNGEMTVKTFRKIDGRVYLISANKKFLPIEISDLMHFEIQGVVKYVISKV